MNRQLLFTKIGLAGSTPPNFYQDLAESFDAVRHDSSAIRADLNRQNALNVPDKTRAATRELTLESLEEGKNVVYDGYLNCAKYREELRDAVSHISGLLIVNLAVKTPHATRKERIIQKNGISPEEELPADISRFIHANRKISKIIQWPGKNEEHLALDGTQNTSTLLQAIHTHVVAQTQPQLTSI